MRMRACAKRRRALQREKKQKARSNSQNECANEATVHPEVERVVEDTTAAEPAVSVATAVDLTVDGNGELEVAGVAMEAVASEMRSNKEHPNVAGDLQILETPAVAEVAVNNESLGGHVVGSVDTSGPVVREALMNAFHAGAHCASDAESRLVEANPDVEPTSEGSEALSTQGDTQNVGVSETSMQDAEEGARCVEQSTVDDRIVSELVSSSNVPEIVGSADAVPSVVVSSAAIPQAVGSSDVPEIVGSSGVPQVVRSSENIPETVGSSAGISAASPCVVPTAIGQYPR